MDFTELEGYINSLFKIDTMIWPIDKVQRIQKMFADTFVFPKLDATYDNKIIETELLKYRVLYQLINKALGQVRGAREHGTAEKNVKKESISMMDSILNNIQNATKYLEGLIKEKIEKQSINIANLANKKSKRANIIAIIGIVIASFSLGAALVAIVLSIVLV